MTPVQAASIPLFLQRKGDSSVWQLIIDHCAAEMIFGKVYVPVLLRFQNSIFFNCPKSIVNIEKVKSKEKKRKEESD
jgi:hypothetical protein